MAAAAILEHRVVLRVLAVLNVVGTVLLIAIIVIFTLDWLQYRAAAPDEARPTMDAGSIKALIKHALVAASLLWLGIAGWRASRAEHRSHRSKAPLIREPGQASS